MNRAIVTSVRVDVAVVTWVKGANVASRLPALGDAIATCWA